MTTVFYKHYTPGATEFVFDREELGQVENVKTPKNLGDIVYSYRYRQELPTHITNTAPAGKTWIIKPAGDALYRFYLANECRILPNETIETIQVIDNSPEMVQKYRTNDEQSVLATVADNGLMSKFLDGTFHRIQSHLRTKIPSIGQVEIDDIYVGRDRDGVECVVPVQAKGGSDQIGPVQTRQDIAACEHKWSGLKCRPVSIHWNGRKKRLAMLELAMQDDSIGIVNETHYSLVSRF
jgi:hypothetical protein